MMPFFRATTCFDPTYGESWENYIEFCKIPGLKEVVSLDTMLCGTAINDELSGDWDYMILDDSGWGYGYFTDLDYLKSRIKPDATCNILGVYRNPEVHSTNAPASGFVFLGYDLIEDESGVSALSNCGGFPETFQNDELNQYGLLPNHSRAREVQKLLPQNNPDEPHANCELYAIWRLETGSAQPR